MIKINNKEFDIEAKVGIKGNTADISFAGSNHWRDIFNAFRAWPHRTSRGDRLHRGAYLSMMSIFWDILEAVPVGVETWKVSGHSLGGAQAMAFVYELAWLIRTAGIPAKKVILHTDGAVKAFTDSAQKITVLNLTGRGVLYEFTHNVYGNDPIPILFPWFKYPGETVILKKRVFPWVDLNLTGGDHVKYWTF
jgi:hypothetical protein